MTAPKTIREPASLPAQSSLEHGKPATEAEAVFARGLIRTQLRLAIGYVIGCCLSLAVISALIALLPPLETVAILGIPWSWLLQAYGLYPVLALFGAGFIRAAARNERRYRSLRGLD